MPMLFIIRQSKPPAPALRDHPPCGFSADGWNARADAILEHWRAGLTLKQSALRLGVSIPYVHRARKALQSMPQAQRLLPTK